MAVPGHQVVHGITEEAGHEDGDPGHRPPSTPQVPKGGQGGVGADPRRGSDRRASLAMPCLEPDQGVHSLKDGVILDQSVPQGAFQGCEAEGFPPSVVAEEELDASGADPAAPVVEEERAFVATPRRGCLAQGPSLPTWKRGSQTQPTPAVVRTWRQAPRASPRKTTSFSATIPCTSESEAG